jgi:Exostosin family
MRAYLLSAYPGTPTTLFWLRESAQADPFGQHRLVDDPDQADIILFAENHAHGDAYCLSVRHHPVYRRSPEKCFVYHDDDAAIAVLRGIYPSIRKRDYLVDRCRSAGYIARVHENDAIRYDPAPRTRRWLYSFLGEANSAVRCSLLRSAHPDGLIRDTTGVRMWQMEPGPARDLFTKAYAETILDSQFVLCPAGYGPSSFRLFEVMEMGRVPVILSDQWVPMPGPRWDEFSVRVPECRVGEIAAILGNYSDRHEVMGQLARRAWEHWFAKPVCFHRLIELCADIQATPLRPYSTLRAWRTLFRSPHLRNYLSPYYRAMIREVNSAMGPLRKLT